ncbi:unnamed protein product [Leptidea sinapis]|uniref:Uncharacterized protein n=1 Tax=Leptidea sinapis TaxID=189913 RepID=A0A5E4PQM5_9NEOP|nr:unnamed protein product [Leptidea sinapis]
MEQPVQGQPPNAAGMVQGPPNGPGPRSQGMEGPNVTDGQRHHITEVRLTTCRGCHRRITMHHLEDRLAIMNSTRRTTSINHLRLGSKIRPMRAVRTRWRLSIE